MKRLTAFLSAVAALLFASCMLESEHGYPDSVTFSDKGGERTVRGKDAFFNMLLADEDGGGQYRAQLIDGVLVVKNSWLTVKSPAGTNEVVLTVRPLSAGMSRAAVLILEFPTNDTAGIDIRQR